MTNTYVYIDGTSPSTAIPTTSFKATSWISNLLHSLSPNDDPLPGSGNGNAGGSGVKQFELTPLSVLLAQSLHDLRVMRRIYAQADAFYGGGEVGVGSRGSS